MNNILRYMPPRKYPTEEKTSTTEGKKEYQKFYMRDFRRRKAEEKLLLEERELVKQLQDQFSIRVINEYVDLSKVTGVGMDTYTPNNGVFSSLKLDRPKIEVTQQNE